MKRRFGRQEARFRARGKPGVRIHGLGGIWLALKEKRLPPLSEAADSLEVFE
jgi:hypothetical protein